MTEIEKPYFFEDRQREQEEQRNLDVKRMYQRGVELENTRCAKIAESAHEKLKPGECSKEGIAAVKAAGKFIADLIRRAE